MKSFLATILTVMMIFSSVFNINFVKADEGKAIEGKDDNYTETEELDCSEKYKKEVEETIPDDVQNKIVVIDASSVDKSENNVINEIYEENNEANVNEYNEIENGTLNDTVQYSVLIDENDSYLLRIFGSGEISDFQTNNKITSLYDKINTLEICSGITRIGINAFKDYDCLSLISIAETVEEISGYSFANDNKIKSITIPESCKDISDYAFYNCSGLETLSIPISTKANSKAFSNVQNIKKIRLTKGNGVYATNDDSSYAWDISKENIEEVEIKDGVKNIKNRVFSGCKKLEIVTLSNNLETIGENAFLGCSALKSISIPETVSLIGKSAFMNCSSLSNLVVPISAKIDEYAFQGVNNLDYIQYTKGTGKAYDYTNSQWAPYYNSRNNENLVVVLDEDITDIGDNSFANCKALVEVFLPNVKEIGDLAFYGCSSIRSIKLSDNLVRIGHNAFNGCSKIEQIQLSNNIQEIGEDAFFGCGALKEINIPNKMKTIETGLFSHCISIEKIVIPKNVETIEEYAFWDCASLKELSIPDSTVVTKDAFKETNIQCIELTKGNKNQFIYTKENYKNAPWSISESDEIKVEISKDILLLSDYMFYGCENLSELIISLSTSYSQNTFCNNKLDNILIKTGNSTNGILSEANYQNSPWYKSCSDNMKIIIEDGVNYLGDSLFKNCLALRSIIIPETITSLGSEVFLGCDNLDEITIPISTIFTKDTFKGVSKLRRVHFTKGNGIGTDYPANFYQYVPWAKGSIKEVVFDEGIKRIGNYFLIGNECEEYNFPSTIESIGEYAFCGNDSIVLIDLPNKLAMIDVGSFCNCSSLETVNITESISKISYKAFWQCTALQQIIIPDSVTDIDSTAFEGCQNVKEITIPVSIEFYNNCISESGYFKNLEKIQFTKGNGTGVDYSQYNSMFPWYQSNKNISVTFDDGITYIGKNMFLDCSNIKEITIPSSIISVGENAFCGVSPNVLNIPINQKQITLEKKEPTCTEPGNTEGYYYRLYNNLEIKSETIPELGHSVTHVSREEPNCRSEGNVEFYYCDTCKKYFSDSDCTKLINNIVLEKTSHKLDTIINFDGEMYYQCSECQGIFDSNNIEIINTYISKLDDRDKLKVIAAGKINSIQIEDNDVIEIDFIKTSDLTIVGDLFTGNGSIERVIFRDDVPLMESSIVNDSSIVVYYPSENVSWKSYFLNRNDEGLIFKELSTYQELKYIVNFETFCNEKCLFQEIYRNDIVDEPSQLYKTGYDFEGWFDISGLKYDFNEPVKKDTTLYAKWNPIDHKINYVLYDKNVNNSMNPSTYNIESGRIVLNNPVRPGYKFLGWYTSDAFKTKVTEIKSESKADMTLYAKWSPITYTIKYNLNGSTNSKSNKTSYTVESPIAFEDPTKKGYEFIGWKNQYGNETTSTQGIYENLVLIAVFELGEYDISLNPNGGILASKQSYDSRLVLNEGKYKGIYTINDATYKLPTLVKDGYKFDGWYDTETNKKVTSIAKGSYGNKELEARFTPVTYKITYNTNSGKLSGAYDSSYSIETTSLQLPNATKTGYELEGWYASYNSKTKEYSNPITSLEELKDYNSDIYKATTLYAKWTPTQYSITFTGSTSPITVDNYSYDSSYKLNEDIFNVPGKTVAKWSYIEKGKTKTIAGNASIRNLPYDEETKSITLTASSWVNAKYTITYNLDGGTNAKNNKKDYTIDTSTFNLEAPTKKGATFLGWYDNPEFGGDNVTSIVKGTYGNKTYYAKWELTPYTITFNADGGTLPSSYESGSITYTVDDVITLENPIKAYNTFAGWYSGKTKVSSIKKGTTQVYNLTAKWTNGASYTISYNPNSTSYSGKVSNTKVSAGKDVTLASNSYKVTNKIFVEWNTEPDGSGVSYQAKEKILKSNPLSVYGNETITLYAIWDDVKQFTIHYEDNCPEELTVPKDQTMYNNAYKALTSASLKRSGYTFDGWISSTGTFYKNKATFSGFKGEDGSTITLYAMWSPVTYKITYKNMKSTDVNNNPASYTILDDDITLSKATRSGYVLEGWYSDSKFKNPVTVIDVSNLKAVTVYAKWVKSDFKEIMNPDAYLYCQGNSFESTKANIKATTIGSFKNVTYQEVTSLKPAGSIVSISVNGIKNEYATNVDYPTALTEIVIEISGD